MKLYHRVGTPSSSRVKIFLRLKGISVDEIDVDIRGRENLTDTFLLKSITGLTPVLELDNGDNISETISICRYIEAISPDDDSLFGTNPLEQAKIDMWQRIIELHGLHMAFDAFRNINQVCGDRENCIEEWGYEARDRLIHFLPKIELQLSHHPYIAGDTFSVADITAFVLVDFLPYVDVFIDEAYPNMLTWHSTLTEIPAFQTA
ncbi:glutathione S-transferase family protein [Veronia pacifica]|uniref:Glutathione S-transferase n=1 Tax=Veronia pacifica TaxID=1080227 RepID=A0A1C3ESE7_9GAMM|nr:glutathione S-transferase N-terminal domain-containing protein [Veronia pacifica]ODA36217.1 glutathione S-transferase [Veronia pacifica]